MWTKTSWRACKHACLQRWLLGCKSEERRKGEWAQTWCASQSCMTQRLRRPGGRTRASYGSRVERCRDLCVCLQGVDFWSLLMLPHYQLLTLAKRQGVCNMAQARLCPRHGNPCGLQRRPGAHIGSVCWLGDKFPLVRWEGGVTSITLLSFRSGGKGVMGSCSDEARQTSVWQHRRGEAMSERDTPTLPQHLAIVSVLSPAHCCV